MTVCQQHSFLCPNDMQSSEDPSGVSLPFAAYQIVNFSLPSNWHCSGQCEWETHHTEGSDAICPWRESVPEITYRRWKNAMNWPHSLAQDAIGWSTCSSTAPTPMSHASVLTLIFLLNVEQCHYRSGGHGSFKCNKSRCRLLCSHKGLGFQQGSRGPCQWCRSSWQTCGSNWLSRGSHIII